MAFIPGISIHARNQFTNTSKSIKCHYHPPFYHRIRACAEQQQPIPVKTTFPKLYDAWFEPEHQIATQMQQAITRAYDDGIRDMELQWPVVPNLEEIAAGTLLNFKFGKQVSRDLGMSSAADYPLIKRYLSSFCNLYWVRCVAQATPFRDRTVWAISSDSISKTRAQAKLLNVKLASFKTSPKDFNDDDIVVIIDPRGNDIWRKGMKMKPKNGCIIFLNSQFNETYGLTGPRNRDLKNVQAVYFLKRITRGYTFFSYPGPWRACLENPDLSIEELKEFEEQPKLRDIAMTVREESNRRYGGFYNDRYVRGFGGRL